MNKIKYEDDIWESMSVETLQDKYKDMEKIKYSFLKGLGKTLVQLAIFGLPILLQSLPSDTLNLTLGAIISMMLNYAKIKYRTL